jgi:hypothetical protein
MPALLAGRSASLVFVSLLAFLTWSLAQLLCLRHYRIVHDGCKVSTLETAEQSLVAVAIFVVLPWFFCFGCCRNWGGIITPQNERQICDFLLVLPFSRLQYTAPASSLCVSTWTAVLTTNAVIQ